MNKYLDYNKYIADNEDEIIVTYDFAEITDAAAEGAADFIRGIEGDFDTNLKSSDLYFKEIRENKKGEEKTSIKYPYERFFNLKESRDSIVSSVEMTIDKEDNILAKTYIEPFNPLSNIYGPFKDEKYIKWIENSSKLAWMEEEFAKMQEYIDIMPEGFSNELANKIAEVVPTGAFKNVFVLPTAASMTTKKMVTHHNIHQAGKLMDYFQPLAVKELSCFSVLDRHRFEFEVLTNILNFSNAVLQRQAHLIREVMKSEYDMLNVGEVGESKVSEVLNTIEGATIFEGMTYKVGEESFETDFIVVLPNGIHIVEVKNYSQNNDISLEFDNFGNMDLYRNEKKEDRQRKSPVAQVKRHKRILKDALGDIIDQDLIKTYVVIANDNVSIRNMSDTPVVKINQLLDAILMDSVDSRLDDETLNEVIFETTVLGMSEKKFPAFSYIEAFEDFKNDLLEEVYDKIMNLYFDNPNKFEAAELLVYGDLLLTKAVLNAQIHAGNKPFGLMIDEILDTNAQGIYVGSKWDQVRTFFLSSGYARLIHDKDKKEKISRISMVLLFVVPLLFYVFGRTPGSRLFSKRSYISGEFVNAFIYAGIIPVSYIATSSFYKQAGYKRYFERNSFNYKEGELSLVDHYNNQIKNYYNKTLLKINDPSVQDKNNVYYKTMLMDFFLKTTFRLVIVVVLLAMNNPILIPYILLEIRSAYMVRKI